MRLPELDRGLPILYFASFVFNMGGAMGLLTVTLYSIEIGATPLQLGIIGMIWPAVFSLCALVTGPLSDRIPRKIPPVAGSILACISFALVSYAETPLQVMLIGIPAGAAFSLVWPPVEAWLGDLSRGPKIRRNFGIFNLSWSIGAAPGPVLAGVAVQISYGFSLAVSIALIAASMVMILLWGVEGPQGKENAGQEPSEDESLSAKFLHLAWIANFATYFTVGAIRSLFPKLGEQMGMSPPTIGALLSMITVSQVIAFALLARSSSWHHRLSLLLSFQALLVGASLLLFFGDSAVGFLPAMVMVGVSAGFSYFSSIYYSLNTGENRGARSGIHEALIGSGIVAGPLTGGVVAQTWGLRSPYILTGMVVVGGLGALVLKVSRRSRPEPTQDEGCNL